MCCSNLPMSEAEFTRQAGLKELHQRSVARSLQDL